MIKTLSIRLSSERMGLPRDGIELHNNLIAAMQQNER